MKYFLAVLMLLFGFAASAQDTSSTANLITNTGWTGQGRTGTQPASTYGCCNGGPGPYVDTTLGKIHFAWGTTTVTQAAAINTALFASQAGLEIVGYTYGWRINNSGFTAGTLTGNVSLKSPTGSVLESFGYNYNQTNIENVKYTGTQNFASVYTPSQLGSISVSFTGKDNRYWAGYYGPVVSEVSLSLNYRTDPCVTNPAYKPTCPGFEDVLTSANLVPYPNSTASVWGSLNNSFAVNTALKHSGTGVTVHGFDYGFAYEINQPYCSSSFLFICFESRQSSAGVNVSITDKNNNSLYSVSHGYTGVETGPVTKNFSYRFTESKNSQDLGNFNFNAWTDGYASVSSMYSRAVYFADPCATNPLFSSSCSGYADAIKNMTASATPQTQPTESVVTVVESAPQQQTQQQSSQPVQPTQTQQTATSAAAVEVQQVQQTTEKEKSSGSSNLSLALSVVKRVQDNDKAVQQAAVQNALSEAASSTSRALQEAASIATSVVSQSIASSTSSVSSTTGATTSTTTQTSTVASAASVMSTSVSPLQQTIGMFGGSSQTRAVQETTTTVSSTPTPTRTEQSMQPELTVRISALTVTTAPPVNYSITEPVTMFSQSFFASQDRKAEEQETFQTQQTGFLNKSNPLSEYFEQKLPIEQRASEQRTETVRQNVQNNELAGSVDIGRLAVAPSGYNSYLNLTLKDASFYAPKDIYPRQNTVDNARALRQLASDRLHQQMIDLQYKNN